MFSPSRLSITHIFASACKAEVMASLREYSSPPLRCGRVGVRNDVIFSHLNRPFAGEEKCG
jgi:hypothetical protein